MPLIVLLLGMCLVVFIVYKTDTHEKEQRHTTAQLNVSTYGERIKNEITNGMKITDTLKQVLISENGEINQFDTIAGNLISDSVESIQLAPEGVVTDIYPAEGNEAGKIDLLHDKDRSRISCYARDNHTIITQGPFKLKQGGYGIAVRNPVYLKDKNGHEYFWGFTIVILRVPDIFSDSISALSNFGYEYKISKTDAPWSDTYKVVYQSNGQINRPVSYTFTIGDENWKFEVTPENGWRNNTLIVTVSTIFTAITLLLSGLTRVWLVSKENKNKFLSFQGKPQNIIKKEQLSRFLHIIIEFYQVTDVNKFSLTIQDCLEPGVPTDRFIMAVSTPSLDSSDTTTGYLGKELATIETAYWITSISSEYNKSGIAIDNVQNDYYQTNGTYRNVKEVINIMNPAPIK